MKIILVFVFAFSVFLATSMPAFARRSSYGSYTVPRYDSNPKYTAPRSQIYVPQTVPVQPYYKNNGTYVPGYNRAPAGALKPYYNPGYRKPLR